MDATDTANSYLMLVCIQLMKCRPPDRCGSSSHQTHKQELDNISLTMKKTEHPSFPGVTSEILRPTL